MSDAAGLSLSELTVRLASGELSSAATVSALSDRIRQVDPQVRAWVALDAERALDEAARCDAERKAGRIRGPLHGVPIGIKDIFETAGIRTGMGSPLFEGYVPSGDAESVRRLKQAGAIVLGKLVTAEFAALDPGPTRNPWNPAHTPGGSSSGSAAAVAARMCPAATGTQTAGSIGRPAAFCGVVGFVPTAARVPREGVFPAAWSLDHVGAFARSVDDVQLMAEVMSGVELSGRAVPERPRIGMLRGYFEKNTEPEAWERHAAFVDGLTHHGFEIVSVELPDAFAASVTALWTIMRAELATVHRERYAEHADQMGTKIRGMIEAGMRIRAVDYVRALHERTRYQRAMRELFNGCDVLVSPGAPGVAPAGLETTGDPVLSAPWTLADFPTLSLPIGLNGEGLPLGIQVSAAPLAEPALLEAGRRIESAAGFGQRLPVIGDHELGHPGQGER